MYSRSKRNSLYRAALLLVQADAHHTLCWSMLKVSGKELDEFPELIARKPPNRSTAVGLWWDKTPEGQAERIRVMTEAIRETDGRGL